jgi:hypothetical protein
MTDPLSDARIFITLAKDNAGTYAGAHNDLAIANATIAIAEALVVIASPREPLSLEVIDTDEASAIAAEFLKRRGWQFDASAAINNWHRDITGTWVANKPPEPAAPLPDDDYSPAHTRGHGPKLGWRERYWDDRGNTYVTFPPAYATIAASRSPRPAAHATDYADSAADATDAPLLLPGPCTTREEQAPGQQEGCTVTPAQTRAKYATIQKRKTLAAQPKHRAHIINATPRDDRLPEWHVVCADCAYEWRKTNAYDHGKFRVHSAARAFVETHNLLNRFISPQRKNT